MKTASPAAEGEHFDLGSRSTFVEQAFTSKGTKHVDLAGCGRSWYASGAD